VLVFHLSQGQHKSNKNAKKRSLLQRKLIVMNRQIKKYRLINHLKKLNYLQDQVHHSFF